MLCIAGKNNIAVEIAEYALNKLGHENLRLIKNGTDNGEDGWQKSLLKFGRINNVQMIGLEQVFEIPNLIFLSLEYDKIIKPNKFITNKLYNIHFSLLPEYKGMYTSYWPIRNGENFSGVTFHKIDHGIDTGDIIAQRQIEIDGQMTAKELYEEYIRNGISLIKEYFDKILTSEIVSYPQSQDNSSYYSRFSLDFSNIHIDLNQTAFDIKNQIRALIFRNYQMPKINNESISHVDILQRKSTELPGFIIGEDEWTIEISTIDYDIKCYKDKLETLLIACEKGDIELVKKFINLKYNLNDQNKFGWTPLIVASYNGKTDIVKLILENGADVNITNYKGTTPLMYAKDFCIKHGDYEIIKILINNGANVNKKDYKGNTIFDYLRINYLSNDIQKILPFLTK